MKFKTMREQADFFVYQAGYKNVLIKIIENKNASRVFKIAAADVYVKLQNEKRGKKIGSVVFSLGY